LRGIYGERVGTARTNSLPGFRPNTKFRAVNDRIVVDPQVQHGKPIIRGTRVPVARVLGGLAGGMSFEEICREYDVTPEDIRAAVGYAEELVEQEVHHPLPG